jgi:hypothetical protein
MSKSKAQMASLLKPTPTSTPVADPATFPERYILIVEGACLEPGIPDDSKILIERDGKIAAGDLAVLYFKPEHVRPGKHSSMLKRVVLPPPSYVEFPWREHPQSEVRAVVIVETTNPGQQFAVRCEHLLGIHKCMGPVEGRS